jgi:hypothetical protein
MDLLDHFLNLLWRISPKWANKKSAPETFEAYLVALRDASHKTDRRGLPDSLERANGAAPSQPASLQKLLSAVTEAGESIEFPQHPTRTNERLWPVLNLPLQTQRRRTF